MGLLNSTISFWNLFATQVLAAWENRCVFASHPSQWGKECAEGCLFSQAKILVVQLKTLQYRCTKVSGFKTTSQLISIRRPQHWEASVLLISIPNSVWHVCSYDCETLMLWKPIIMLYISMYILHAIINCMSQYAAIHLIIMWIFFLQISKSLKRYELDNEEIRHSHTDEVDHFEKQIRTLKEQVLII